MRGTGAARGKTGEAGHQLANQKSLAKTILIHLPELETNKGTHGQAGDGHGKKRRKQIGLEQGKGASITALVDEGLV